MKTVANIIWFILFGMIPCAIHYVLGAVLCCTFVFFPAGMALFKLARLEAFPFKKVTELRADEPSIPNVLFGSTIGAVTALFYLIIGLVLCITIVGIPFAKQCAKIARFAHVPFGSDVYDEDMTPSNHISA